MLCYILEKGVADLDIPSLLFSMMTLSFCVSAISSIFAFFFIFARYL